jgi:peptide/nickel transport system substrate-binding protein
VGAAREGAARAARLRQGRRHEGEGQEAAGEAGFTPQNPLKVEIVTRNIAVYVDMASFVINELKQVGIEANLKQIETAQWHAMATRGDYQIGANLTGLGPDDPDANFYENYGCGSPRNYSGYCNEEIQKLIDAQSAELDPKKRLALIAAIQKKLEDDAGRPVLSWRLDYFTVWPHVKNMIPHQSIFNFGASRKSGATGSLRRGPRRTGAEVGRVGGVGPPGTTG